MQAASSQPVSLPQRIGFPSSFAAAACAPLIVLTASSPDAVHSIATLIPRASPSVRYFPAFNPARAGFYTDSLPGGRRPPLGSLAGGEQRPGEVAAAVLEEGVELLVLLADVEDLGQLLVASARLLETELDQ